MWRISCLAEVLSASEEGLCSVVCHWHSNVFGVPARSVKEAYVCHSQPYTYSMVQNPSWEVNCIAASQEIPRISRNPKVHYRIHKRPPLSLSWASPIQSIYPHPTSWWSILILSTRLCLGLPSDVQECYIVNQKHFILVDCGSWWTIGQTHWKVWWSKQCQPLLWLIVKFALIM